MENCNQEKILKTIKRKEYYDKGENRKIHNERMALYREKNRFKIQKKKRTIQLEKKLIKIWKRQGRIPSMI